jgi:hypothetical protein
MNMKKVIALICIALCAMLSAPCVSAQALIFSNQTITVDPQNLAVESVEFRPLEVVTNTVFQWLDADAVYTNFYYGWKPDEIVTNTVSRQVSVNVISTNAATWTCNVIFSLPAGHQWSLNGMPVTIERFKTRLRIPVSRSAVQSLFGAASSGLEFAAQNGAYQPNGQVKNGFLSLAAGILVGGGQ